MRRLWRSIARRLPPDVVLGVMAIYWLPSLALYRLSGRRLPDSPDLYRTGLIRQLRERPRIPGMTSMMVRAYLKWHAQEVLTGAGTVVDLGSWLGSTTAALAMGLSANRRPAAARTVIHAYDEFVWDPRFGHYSPPLRLGPYEAGDSFRAEFELVVRRWSDRIAVHEGDLLQGEGTGEPIELLVVDVMKSWELTTHVLRHFYSELIAPQGYLIHQDFSHCFTPWIPLTSYRLLPYLEPVKDIPRSETLVFRAARPVPLSELGLGRESFEESEVEEAFRYWLRTTEPNKHSGLRTARILLAHYDGDAERAQRMRASLTADGLLSEVHRAALRAVMDR